MKLGLEPTLAGFDAQKLNVWGFKTERAGAIARTLRGLSRATHPATSG
jgi:hypothetical protein